MTTILACRDPEEYDRPNEIDLDRAPRQIMTFGNGPHVCIGMHLARRELQIALEEFLAAIPEFRIAPGARIMTHLGGMVQPQTRSEEHTSELQSLMRISYAVFCLKKKKTHNQ